MPIKETNTIKATYKLLTYLIAAVWLINGLFCKVLNLVPRHQQIVATILHTNQSEIITVTIGVLEILMAIWILSGIQSRFNAIVQMAIVLAMNVIEFILAPQLLLFGRLNLVIALFFIGVVYCWEFVLNKQKSYVSIS